MDPPPASTTQSRVLVCGLGFCVSLREGDVRTVLSRRQVGRSKISPFGSEMEHFKPLETAPLSQPRIYRFHQALRAFPSIEKNPRILSTPWVLLRAKAFTHLPIQPFIHPSNHHPSIIHPSIRHPSIHSFSLSLPPSLPPSVLLPFSPSAPRLTLSSKCSNPTPPFYSYYQYPGSEPCDPLQTTASIKYFICLFQYNFY